MTVQLYVVGGGAVTPVGLNARQSCAAIRAGISGYTETLRTSPLGSSQAAARVPADWRLRCTPVEWLVNMAAKAITEVVEHYGVEPEKTMFLLVPPERFRDGLFFNESERQSFISSIAEKTARHFSALSQLVEGGAASLIPGLERAAQCIGSGEVSYVILGGVDSYVFDLEYTRLDTAGRLKGDDTVQGLIPGEAAVFLLLSAHRKADSEFSAKILGWGTAMESNPAGSKCYSQGKAVVEALAATVAHARCEEAAVDLIISNANGERYSSWEAMIARPRFYRTRREFMPISYPAMSVGETGAASGALALLIAGHSFSKGYSLGRTAMLEINSEGKARAACLVAATSNNK